MRGRVGAVCRAAMRAGAIVAVLLLAACYDSDTEVIPASLAETLPFRGTRVEWMAGGHTQFAPVPFSKDFRFEEHRTEKVKTGTLRGLRVKGDIFAIQARYDDEAGYYLVFYRITATAVNSMEVTATEAQKKQLAARFRVGIEDSGLSTSLAGTPEAMLGFIRAHSQFSFRDNNP